MTGDIQERINDLFADEFAGAVDAIVLHKTYVPDEINLAGYMNLRDSLHHLRCLLNAKESPEGDQVRQENLACAREHLRRAATDAHQSMFEKEYKKVESKYDYYRRSHMHKESSADFVGEHTKIVSDLQASREVLKRFRIGRAGDKWLSLIVDLSNECDRLREIHDTIELYTQRITQALS